jgi:hypothetical protein
VTSEKRFAKKHVGNVRDGLDQLAGWIGAARKRTDEGLHVVMRAANDIIDGDDDALEGWLRARGIQKWAAVSAVKYAHERWPGKELSRWNLVSGLTFTAQEYESPDSRYELEVEAGKILVAVR